MTIAVTLQVSCMPQTRSQEINASHQAIPATMAAQRSLNQDTVLRDELDSTAVAGEPRACDFVLVDIGACGHSLVVCSAFSEW